MTSDHAHRTAETHPHKCDLCDRRFKTPNDLYQHDRMKHNLRREAEDDFSKWRQNADVRTRREVFESVVDEDMPDGAYFAMAQEFGLDPEDLI